MVLVNLAAVVGHGPGIRGGKGGLSSQIPRKGTGGMGCEGPAKDLARPFAVKVPEGRWSGCGGCYAKDLAKDLGFVKARSFAPSDLRFVGLAKDPKDLRGGNAHEDDSEIAYQQVTGSPRIKGSTPPKVLRVLRVLRNPRSGLRRTFDKVLRRSFAVRRGVSRARAGGPGAAPRLWVALGTARTGSPAATTRMRSGAGMRGAPAATCGGVAAGAPVDPGRRGTALGGSVGR